MISDIRTHLPVSTPREPDEAESTAESLGFTGTAWLNYRAMINDTVFEEESIFHWLRDFISEIALEETLPEQEELWDSGTPTQLHDYLVDKFGLDDSKVAQLLSQIPLDILREERPSHWIRESIAEHEYSYSPQFLDFLASNGEVAEYQPINQERDRLLIGKISSEFADNFEDVFATLLQQSNYPVDGEYRFHSTTQGKAEESFEEF